MIGLVATLVATASLWPAAASAATLNDRRLPAGRWMASLDISLPRGSAALLELGGPRVTVGLAAGRGGVVATTQGRPLHRHARRSRRAARWIHLEAMRGAHGVAGSVGGAPFRLGGKMGRRLRLRAVRGRPSVEDLVTSHAGDPRALLLHRLLDLDSRVARGRFLAGADVHDRLHTRGSYWTRGFLAGALWQADRLAPGAGLFARRALPRSLAVGGFEARDTHDVGFVYENAFVAALEAECGGSMQLKDATCLDLRANSVLAARRLVSLAATNAAAGTVPTHSTWPSAEEADTIIDSLMNLPLLYWASDATGDGTYREVAARHARRVAQLLLRSDGSTAQSVHTDRATGAVLKIHTHQGASDGGTWARGQAWAVYGFTASAAALRDPVLLEAAERAAGFVERELPASGVPSFDYSVPWGPPDVSAAAITAAGLYRLDRLCRSWAGACRHPEAWRPLAARALRGTLRRVRRSAPFGYLGHQVGTYGGRQWDDRAELVYGLRYALEAVSESLRGGHLRVSVHARRRLPSTLGPDSR